MAQLRPRYPLYGGWSADFVFGYSLPLSPFVAKLPGGTLQLTAWLGPAVRDLITEDLTVKVRPMKLQSVRLRDNTLPLRCAHTVLEFQI